MVPNERGTKKNNIDGYSDSLALLELELFTLEVDQFLTFSPYFRKISEKLIIQTRFYSLRYPKIQPGVRIRCQNGASRFRTRDMTMSLTMLLASIVASIEWNKFCASPLRWFQMIEERKKLRLEVTATR
jgi:hypothetical protein